MSGRLFAWAALALAVGIGCQPAAESRTHQVPAEFEQYVLKTVPAEVEHQSLIDFEGKVHLVGHDLEPTEPVSPGSSVTLTMYWKPVAPLGPGWSLFTHVVDQRGRRVERLEGDGQGFDDVGPLRRREQEGGPQAYPPSLWVVGKVYRDVQPLRIPSAVEAAELTILVGIGQEFQVPEPVRTPAAAGEPEAEESDQTGTSDAEEAAQPPRSRGIRLRVLSGPTDGENRAVVAHLKLRARPASAKSQKERRGRRKAKRARARRGKPDRRIKLTGSKPRRPPQVRVPKADRP
jgi:hypothetical protein